MIANFFLSDSVTRTKKASFILPLLSPHTSLSGFDVVKQARTPISRSMVSQTCPLPHPCFPTRRQRSLKPGQYKERPCHKILQIVESYFIVPVLNVTCDTSNEPSRGSKSTPPKSISLKKLFFLPPLLSF